MLCQFRTQTLGPELSCLSPGPQLRYNSYTRKYGYMTNIASCKWIVEACTCVQVDKHSFN